MKYLLLLLCLVGLAWGQNWRYDSIALGPRGPIPFATVAVCTQPANTATAPCSPLASLCSSLTDAVCTSANPVTADLLGNYHFYAKSGVGYLTTQIYGPQVSTPQAYGDQSSLNFPNPSVFPGGATFNGTVAINGGGSALGIVPDPLNLCAFSFGLGSQDQLCNLNGQLVWNPVGVTGVNYLILWTKYYDLFGNPPPDGTIFAWVALDGSLEEVPNVAANNGRLTAQKHNFSNTCTSTAVPAVCGTAQAGFVAIPAGSTTLTINTTAVAASSIIIAEPDASLGTMLGVTCNGTLNNIEILSRVAGTSFTVETNNPVTNPECMSFVIFNPQ